MAWPGGGRRRRWHGRDELDGRAGLGDGGEIEDGGGGDDRRVDQKVEDEQNRNCSIYIGRDPLVKVLFFHLTKFDLVKLAQIRH